MGVVRGAVGCVVAALLLGHQLSTMDPGRRTALWSAARAALGADGGAAVAPAARAAVAVPPRPASRSAPPPVAPPPTGFGEESIAPDRFGQYHAGVEIDGLRLPVMVDTGATFVALSAEDADRLGIHPMPSDFRHPVNTANGRALVAEVRLASVRLGGIEVRDVTALVGGRGQLGESLLGMSFLSRLSALRIDAGRLVLRQ